MYKPGLIIAKISIYIKEQRFFPLCANSSWTNEHIWTNDTSLEPAWHVDGFFWLKISIPTAMEWPGTQTCPKTWTIANNSETMGRIEILRSRYVLQLLIFVSGGGTPPEARKHFSPIRRSIWSPERFCRFWLCLERKIQQGPNTIDTVRRQPTIVLR